MKKRIGIVGAGPAGMSAATYCARSGYEVVVFEGNAIGGTMAELKQIDNIVGLPNANGTELAQVMYKQVLEFGVRFIFEEVVDLRENNETKILATDFGEYEFDAVIIAVGSRRKTLGIEKGYIGKGVSYCAVCDGFFYKGQPVAVFGQGNTAINDALYLANICSKVYLIYSSDKLTGQSELVEKLSEFPNVECISKTAVKGLTGEPYLESLRLYNLRKKEEYVLSAAGLFIALGGRESRLTQDLKRSAGGVLARKGIYTSMKGVFAAGDCVAGQMKQVVAALYDGARCSEAASRYVHKLEKQDKE